jgi:hypothetical protein
LTNPPSLASATIARLVTACSWTYLLTGRPSCASISPCIKYKRKNVNIRIQPEARTGTNDIEKAGWTEGDCLKVERKVVYPTKGEAKEEEKTHLMQHLHQPLHNRVQIRQQGIPLDTLTEVDQCSSSMGVHSTYKDRSAPNTSKETYERR